MTDITEQHTGKLVDHLFRHQAGKMTALLINHFGFSCASFAEDIIQETFVAALRNWGIKGMPEKPEAWLFRVAKNKTLNELKRRKHTQPLQINEAQFLLADESEIEQIFLEHQISDSQLNVLIACCDPDLNDQTQVMLTLKILSGFGDVEISRAFMIPQQTVKKRVYRAKKKLSAKQNQLQYIKIKDLSARIDSVLTVLYLMFNEGHKTTNGSEIINADLCFEAIRLTTLLTEFDNTDNGKTYALLSLMYLVASRFPARYNQLGEFVDFASQDRSLWDKKLIDRGIENMTKSRESTELSRYHLLGTIQAIYAISPAFEYTDWETILMCYDQLLVIEPSFPVKLNRAIALSWHHSPKKALNELNRLKESIPEGYSLYYFSAIGEMYFRMNDVMKARSYYQIATDHIFHQSDLDYLNNKIKECDTLNIHPN